MNKRFLNRFLTFSALALLAPLAGQAQSNRLELTPFAAYHWGGTITTEASDLFLHDVDVKDSEAFGVTLDIPISRYFQLELLASRQQSELEVDRGLFDDNSFIADVDVDYFHVGMLWQAGGGQVVPFFVVSGGVTRLDPAVPGADAESRPSLSMGGGVKIFVNEHLGFRFEGRGFYTDLAKDDNRHCDHHCYDDSQNDFSQGVADVGLILRF